MLVNFDHSFDSSFGFLVNDIVRVSYAVHLMLVFPVIHFTLRANVDELMFPNKVLLATDRMRFVSLTCVLLAFVYIVAVIVPNIWYFFQFMGSTTVACIVFVFPGAIVLRYNFYFDNFLYCFLLLVIRLTFLFCLSTEMFMVYQKERTE